MTDQTSDLGHEPARARKAPRGEFYVYFGIIFLATLPLACLTWALSTVKSAGCPKRARWPVPGPRRGSSRR
jgi:hypothetical protein